MHRGSRNLLPLYNRPSSVQYGGKKGTARKLMHDLYDIFVYIAGIIYRNIIFL